MNQKRARAKFYSALRSRASEYRWEIIGGGIRGWKEFYMYCPLTAVGSKEERIKLPDFEMAAANLSMNQRSARLIADSADNSKDKYNKQVRQTLLRCVGLS